MASQGHRPRDLSPPPPDGVSPVQGEVPSPEAGLPTTLPVTGQTDGATAAACPDGRDGLMDVHRDHDVLWFMLLSHKSLCRELRTELTAGPRPPAGSAGAPLSLPCQAPVGTHLTQCPAVAPQVLRSSLPQAHRTGHTVPSVRRRAASGGQVLVSEMAPLLGAWQPASPTYNPVPAAAATPEERPGTALTAWRPGRPPTPCPAGAFPRLRFPTVRVEGKGRDSVDTRHTDWLPHPRPNLGQRSNLPLIRLEPVTIQSVG